MTVFFALLSVVYLTFVFVLVESVRMQGARAQCEHIAQMGNYSLFSEYEKKLLTDFDLFGLDGSYGTGDFHIDRVNEHLMEFLEKNAQPTDGILRQLCFDPWKLQLQDGEVTAYTLLTDRKGEGFYQQAVAYMRKTAITGVGWKLLRWYQLAKDEEEKQEIYERERLSADKELEELEAAQKELEEEKKQQAEDEEKENGREDFEEQTVHENNTPGESGNDRESSGIKDPVPALRKLRRKDILSILCPDAAISNAYVIRSQLPSRRFIKKGTLPVVKTYSGTLNNLFFKEYLLDHFTSFLGEEKEGALKYELEYILCGKKEDRKNLKGTASRLLLLREGSNYLYCSSDEGMSSTAGGLAAILIGWTQIPALTAVLKHILLIGWAYAESLLDVRALMSGGKVEVLKDESTWKLGIEDLASINELLAADAGSQESGLDYRGYLRLLLYLQPVSQQKKRGLDLVELRVSAGEGLEQFRADHCITAIRCSSTWNIPPLFSAAAGAWLGAAGIQTGKEVRSAFAYLH